MSLEDRLPCDNNLNPLQVPKLGTSQDVSFDGSVQSVAFAATTKVIRLCSTQDCRFLVSANPTALATSARLPANTIAHIEVTGGHKIAAIKDADTGAAGKLNVVECV